MSFADEKFTNAVKEKAISHKSAESPAEKMIPNT